MSVKGISFMCKELDRMESVNTGKLKLHCKTKKKKID